MKKEGDQNLLHGIPALLESKFGIKNMTFTVVAWIPLLYQGWELDPWAVLICLSDGKKLLISPEHGRPQIVEDPKTFLESFENQYKSAAERCAEAKVMLFGLVGR